MGQSGVARARQYAADVLAGRVVVCRWVRLAIERQARDLKRQGTDEFPFVFDPVAAERIITAAELLPHIKGPLAKVVGREGKRKIWNTITLVPWQCWVLTEIFGWRHRETGLRRYRTALIMVPRKNAKSTLAAVIALYMLACDNESGPEIYSAATTRKQAGIVFQTARSMARRAWKFCEQFGVDVSRRDVIEVPETDGTFIALSSDADTLDGLNPSLAVVDEVHAHKTRHVWDVIETAIDARDQPLLLPISTAGFNTGGICYELLQFGQRVLEQSTFSESFFVTNYTIDEGDMDRWSEEDVWQKANPNYAISVSPTGLREKAIKAQTSPGARNNFLTKHLNVWANRETAWADLPGWARNTDAALRLADCAGQRAWIGVDMGARRDFSATVMVVPDEDGRCRVFGRYYLPAATIDQSPIAQLSGWVSDGWVIATPGETIDHERIEDDIVQWCSAADVQEIVADPALFQRIGPSLMKKLGDCPVVVEQKQTAIWQAYWLARLDEMIKADQVPHQADPVIAWMMANVVGKVVYLGGKEQVVPRKGGGKDSHQHIDGVLALELALSRALVEPDNSAYESRGLMVL